MIRVNGIVYGRGGVAVPFDLNEEDAVRRIAELDECGADETREHDTRALARMEASAIRYELLRGWFPDLNLMVGFEYDCVTCTHESRIWRVYTNIRREGEPRELSVPLTGPVYDVLDVRARLERLRRVAAHSAMPHSAQAPHA